LIKRLVNPDTGADSVPPVPWPMQVTDSAGVSNNFFTNTTDGSVKICGLTAGTYTASESDPVGFSSTPVGLVVNGVSLPAQPLYSFFWNTGSPDPFVILFRNQASSLPQ